MKLESLVTQLNLFAADDPVTKLLQAGQVKQAEAYIISKQQALANGISLPPEADLGDSVAAPLLALAAAREQNDMFAQYAINRPYIKPDGNDLFEVYGHRLLALELLIASTVDAHLQVNAELAPAESAEIIALRQEAQDWFRDVQAPSLEIRQQAVSERENRGFLQMQNEPVIGITFQDCCISAGVVELEQQSRLREMCLNEPTKALERLRRANDIMEKTAHEEARMRMSNEYNLRDNEMPAWAADKRRDDVLVGSGTNLFEQHLQTMSQDDAPYDDESNTDTQGWQDSESSYRAPRMNA